MGGEKEIGTDVAAPLSVLSVEFSEVRASARVFVCVTTVPTVTDAIERKDERCILLAHA